MKFSLCLTASLIIFLTGVGCAQKDRKPRVIVTTDGEFDDRCSMVRFLLYANEFDVRGLIHSSSKFHWKGNENQPGHDWHEVSWIEEHLEAYEHIYPNLLVHSPDYPSPEDLKKQVFVGNIELPGDMNEETPGSKHIVQVLLDPDPSPVWLQAWGGSNTIARALKTIEEKHPERKEEISQKVKIFLIMLQDTTYEAYIQPHWPEATVLLSTAFPSIGYPWKKSVPEELHPYYSMEWMDENVLLDHGPLCEIYRRHLYGARQTGAFISEGDSPSFMHQIPTGLRSTEDPSWGGWGGRFVWQDKGWVSALDDGNKFKTIYRWIPQFQNDWAARADWCVVERYEDANHPPIVEVDVEESFTKAAGSRISINAKASSDPDRDRLSFRWWRYADADSYPGSVKLENTANEQLSFTLPDEIKSGETVHIICEVSDDGQPSLTRYKRIVVTAE